MQGRKPVPTALKVLRGNPGQRPLPANEPRPEVAAPDPPSWLRDDARAEWARIVPELLALGLVTRLDRDTLAGYCDALAEWKSANEALEGGLFTKRKRGEFLHTHPAVAIRRQALADIRKFAALFGLSPADRARVHGLPTNADEKTPIERLRAPIR